MNETFKKLAPEKQQRIIKAALREFAGKGFQHASTNEIVKHAGIGKGMLFYYFNSKKELYYFLVDYCLDSVKKDYIDQIDDSIKDVIQKLAHISYLKLKYFKEYPEISKFISTVFLKESETLPEELQKKLARIVQEGMEKTYAMKRVDNDLFRDDIDPEKAAQLIRWTMLGYQQDFMEKYRGKGMDEIPLKKLWDDFDEYLEILKVCFYSQEGKSDEHH